MKEEIEINEWIETCLNGNLSAEEVKLFRKRLEEEPDFAREVERHRQLREIISDGALLHVKNQLMSIHLQKLKTVRKIRRITGYGLGGILVGILTLLVVRISIDDENVQKLSGRAIPETKTPVIVSDQTGAEELTVELMQDSGTHARETAQDIKPTGNDIKTENHAMSASMDTFITGIGREMTGTNLNPVKTPPDTAIYSETRQDEENEPDTASKKASEANCRKIKLEGNFIEYESCNNKPTGGIMIYSQSVTGGMPPYTFSLNGTRFIDTIQFSGLYPGNYPVYARDANNCISRLGLALVRSVDCTYQAVFAPLKGEIWTVPADQDREGILNIFNKSGTLVYTIRISNDETTTWNGSTLSGQALPMGIYQFEIRYSDGSRFIGNVTIVK